MHVPVPLGTLVRDNSTGEIIGELTDPEQELIVARGGYVIAL
jgi:GTP-binding protein